MSLPRLNPQLSLSFDSTLPPARFGQERSSSVPTDPSSPNSSSPSSMPIDLVPTTSAAPLPLRAEESDLAAAEGRLHGQARPQPGAEGGARRRRTVPIVELSWEEMMELLRARRVAAL